MAAGRGCPGRLTSILGTGMTAVDTRADEMGKECGAGAAVVREASRPRHDHVHSQLTIMPDAAGIARRNKRVQNEQLRASLAFHLHRVDGHQNVPVIPYLLV